MERPNSKQIFYMLDPACLLKQVQINPDFETIFLKKSSDLDDLEISESQKSRLRRLLGLLSLAFLDSEFDFVVLDAMKAFIYATSYEDPYRLDNIYRSFITVPKSFGPCADTNRRIENVRGPNKFRPVWGRKPISLDILKKYHVDAWRYCEILAAAKGQNKIS